LIKSALELKNWILAILALSFIACSSDDDGGNVPSGNSTLQFTVIGEDLDNVYQLSYDSSLESQNIINLTTELGVGPNYLTLRQTDDLVSFYSFSGGRFSLYLKEIETNAIQVFNDFYTNTPQRSVTWGLNDKTNVFFGYFGPFGSPNLGLQDLTFDGNDETDVVVDFNVDATFGPLLFDGKVYMAFRDNLGNYKLRFYDTTTKSVGPTLDFGTTAFSFFISETGDVAVVKVEANPTLELYRADDLGFIESYDLNVNLGFNLGVVDDALLIGDNLYFNFVYPQPSRFVEGPAIYNLQTDEVTILNIGGLVNLVESEIGKSVLLINQVFDSVNNVFLMGYGTSGNEVEGGVIVASENGELLARIELPFFPTYFVRN
jgi:hypothetical protein